MRVSDLFDEPSTLSQLTAALDSAQSQLRELLDAPLDVFSDWRRVEHLLLSAQAQLPEHLEFSMALYKMYAYANRHHDAMALIDDVLRAAALRSGLPFDANQLQVGHAQWKPISGATRQYLYTLKAKAFVLLRQNSLAAAEAVLSKLALVDPLDYVGSSVVRSMADRLREREDPENFN